MSSFKTNIINIYDDKGQAWLRTLPHLVKELAVLWELSDLKPAPNLSYNYVLSGFQGTSPIILKLGPDGETLQKEAAALRVFEGFGAIKILEQQEGALLLERAVPGTSLKTYLPKRDTEAIQIACQVTRKLHQAPAPPEGSFPHIREWFKALDRRWDIPQQYLEKARRLLNHLLENPSAPVLLHGDLHHENILQNDKDWLVIDPKGVIGAPINDVWAFIVSFEMDTQFAADFFNFPLEDVRSWYFVHLMLAACWNVEDKVTPNLFLSLAERTYPLV